MSLPAFGIRRPVAANLLMFAIIGAGLILGTNLRREFFPEVRPNEVIVTAPYPSAAPDEVEQALAIKIEDRLADLRDVKEINTTALEGAASVRVEFEPGVNIETAVSRVKREIDALEDLPEDSERIIVTEFEPNIPVISLMLYGDVDERTMKRAINRVRDDLSRLPGMGDLLVAGTRNDEISVEVRHAALLEHGLSLPDVAGRITESMVELPGGAVRAPTANVAIRTLGAKDQADEVRGIVVKSDPDGRNVTIGEIAEVTAGFADVDLRTRFNLEPTASVTIYAVGGQDVIQIADMVKAYMAGLKREEIDLTFAERMRMRAGGGELTQEPPRVMAHRLGMLRELPQGVELALHNDLARFVSQRLQLLARNALWGCGLVFLTLLVMLAPRVALWVSVGLVLAVLGTLVLMRIFDISLNLITMFGLIVVIGLLVDDAIVVAENITSHYERGEPALAAAEGGAMEVAWPITVMIMTTICAFMPLRLIEGNLGDMLGMLPIVVTCALLVSLIECLFILPSHMGHSLQMARRSKAGALRRWMNNLERMRLALFQRIMIPGYERMLNFCLDRRWLTLVTAIAILIFSFGMVNGERVPFVFAESADAENVVVDLRMPVGTPLRITDETVRQIERFVLDTPEVLGAFTIIGAQQDLDGPVGQAQSHLAQIFFELHPSEKRDRTSREIIDGLRVKTERLAGIKSLRFEELGGGPGGPDITLTVTGESIERIMAVVEQVKEILDDYEGVMGISDDADSGQRELRFSLRPGASELGFTTAGVARQVRAAVFGLEAHTFAGDREDVDVRVMLDREMRRSLAAIEAMHIFSPTGEPTPLAEVVEISEERSYATIRRLDRRRAVTIFADVAREAANPEQIMNEIAPLLAEVDAANPDVRILQRGRQKEMADALRTLPLGMAVAVGLIYVILAWLFSSYLQPIIVLCAVPFASIGVIWGHYLMGFEMTILSLIGFIALTGIVVNDSLILMEFYNARQREGQEVREALVNAGRARLRAILLTTMTTVLGLSPLMAEQAFQARFLIPMAITISFGLMSASFIILLALPCMLLISDDIKRKAIRLWRGGDPSPFDIGRDDAAHHPEHEPRD
ncbi:MAG: efflux RND transporter permease subunit [Phycisphaeraceae bacterium]|nr:MAG: efflux RND transporter permease subunit [Phycisphaeraceae bacterium]